MRRTGILRQFGRVAGYAALLAVAAARAPGGEIAELEFRNARIADILVALGSAAGQPVIPDETVRGSASYYFPRTTFDRALAAFAAQFDLFVEETEGVYVVSAISVAAGPDGLLTVRAPAVDATTLLRRLSRSTLVPVFGERLPAGEISYFAESLPLAAILAQLALRLPDHDLVERDGAFLYAYRDPIAPAAVRGGWVERDGELYSLRAAQAPLPALLAELFTAGRREYQLLKRGAPVLEDLRFTRREFDELLRLVLDRSDAAFAVVDDVYYVTDAHPQAASARALITRTVTLERLGVAALMDLLPPERTAGVSVRADRSSGALAVTGHEEAVARVERLIRELDAVSASGEYRRFDLSYVSAAAIPGLLPRHLASVPITPLADGYSFVALATPRQAEELESFVALVDTPRQRFPFELEHIRTSQLLERLPPSARRSHIVETNDPARFFFVGSAAEAGLFADDLRTIDRPLPQLTYRLLVVQFQEGRSLAFDFDVSNTVAGPDAAQIFLASLGNLLSLDFDVVAAFGYQFAVRLDAQMGSATAAILADASLSGLSGEQVRFENTSTYRYREMANDPQTGKPAATGVIREITSGLVLQITGWVGSGDAVTMEISASVSKRGTDASAEGNPPPTSERIVRTTVRARSGTPVAVSGLLQQESDRSLRETPVLSRIPVLRWLFTGRRESVDTTELAIYIVPLVDRGERTDQPLDRRLMELYERHARRTP